MIERFKDISELPRVKRLKTIKNIMDLNDTIIFCIEHKFKMDILYEETGVEGGKVLNGYRNISPAAFGKHITTNNLVLRAYLNAGVSKSERTPYWRLFRLDRIKQFNVNYSKTNVKNRKSYRMNDKHMGEIYSQLKKSFDTLIL